MKKLFFILFNLPFFLFAADPLIFVVNQGENQVEVYNILNNNFESPITYAGFDLGYGNITFNNGFTKIYITNYNGNFISVFDAASYAHIDDFGSAPDLQNPEELAFSAEGSKLYVSNYSAINNQSVAVYDIDPTTGLGTFSHHFGGSVLSPTQETATLVLNGSHNRLYLVNGGLNKVSVFDLPTETLIGEFTDPSLNEPLGGFYDALENKLYLTNFNSNNISVFNINPLSGLGIFSGLFGSGSELQGPEDLVFSEDQTKIYVGNFANFITEYNSQGNFVQQIFAPSNTALMTGLGVNFLEPFILPHFTKANAFTICNEFFTATCIYNELSWAFSNPNMVLSYQIFRKEGNDFKLLQIINPGEALKIVDSDVKKGEFYEYKIIAILQEDSVEQIFFSTKK